MKKITLFVSAALLFTIGSAYAQSQTAKNCGCGLGTMLLQEQGDGLATQTAAATTNGSFGNQTFGITSGTLGCEKEASVAMREKLNIFIADNMDNIAVDIASGQGETLDAIADLAEVSIDDRAKFYHTLQNNFEVIYSNPDVTHSEVVQKIYDIIVTI